MLVFTMNSSHIVQDITFWILWFVFFPPLQMGSATIRGNSSNVKFLAIPLSFQILGKITGLTSMCPTLFLPSINKQLGLCLRERLNFAISDSLNISEETIQLANIQRQCPLHPDVEGALFCHLQPRLSLSLFFSL